jgi:hypothetical protein
MHFHPMSVHHFALIYVTPKGLYLNISRIDSVARRVFPERVAPVPAVTVLLGLLAANHLRWAEEDVRPSIVMECSISALHRERTSFECPLLTETNIGHYFAEHQRR